MNAAISAADLAVLLWQTAIDIAETQRTAFAEVARDARDELNGLRRLSPHRRRTLERFLRGYEALRIALGPWAAILELRHDSRCEIEIGPTRFDVLEVSRTIEGYVIRGEGVFYTLPGLIERLGRAAEKAA